MARDPLQHCSKRHKVSSATLSVSQSQQIWQKYGILIPVGAGFCRQCRGRLTVKLQTDICNVDNTLTQAIHEPTHSICTMTSEKGLINKLGRLKRPLSGVQGENKEKDITFESQSTVDTDHSQGSLWMPNSQNSYTSTDTACTDNTDFISEKRKYLDSFLASCGLSPVKKQMRGDWTTSSDRTRNDYLKKAKQILQQVAEVLVPGQGDYLLNEISCLNSSATCSTTSEKMLEVLCTAYNQTTDWGTQRQLLSLFSHDYSLAEIRNFIPKLSKYKFTAARKHSVNRGMGQPVQESMKHREGLSDHQVQHFIDFVMSPCIMTDSPFLETKLKLSNGEIHQVPQIILNSVRSRVVEQYQAFCIENEISETASDRSYMRILQAIEPNIRKSMKGLDNFAAEGAKAIDDLKKTTTVFGKQLKGVEWEEEIIHRLNSGKQYLKLEYKLHISEEATIPDHCCHYALSTSEQEYSMPCSHLHDVGCPSCEDLYQVTQELKAVADEVVYESNDQKDDIQYTLSQSLKALEDWKKHILRSVNQDKARSDICEDLKDDEVLIERDWAMKFLPLFYRESQSKWFGKRGLNWHIAVGTYKKDGNLHSHTIVHIFDNANQDTLTSNAILKDCIVRLKSRNDSLKKAYIRSDNAGCFHSAEGIFCITSLNLESDLKVVQMNFAEPQSGKSICDRRAAHIKSSVRKFVNEGNNVTTSEEFLNAVAKSNMKNVEIVNATPPADQNCKRTLKVKDITTLNNFEYEADHVVVFKQYKIGTGHKLLNEKHKVYNEFPSITVVKSFMTSESIKIPKQIPVQNMLVESQSETSNELSIRNDDVVDDCNDDDDVDVTSSSCLYTCPEPNCLQSFQKYGNLNRHLDIGKHKYRKEGRTLSDKSKKEYIEKINTKKATLYKRTISSETIPVIFLERGWALKSKRTVRKFSDEQTSFLREMFQKGEATGHKCDPEEVSVTMRTTKKNGKRRFSQSDFLTSTQISSYFSRLVLEKRKAASSEFQNKDLEAEEYENNIRSMRNLAKQ
ncbi:uncharacterized protein LOC111121882 isoform X2 [Crassostrea virginica]